VLQIDRILKPVKMLAQQVEDWLTKPRVAIAVGEVLFRTFGYRRVSEFTLEKVKRVLIVRVDQIGDAVLFTPLVRELRRALPDATITLVVNTSARELFENCPYVDRVYGYDWRTEERFPILRRHWRALKLAATSLWKEKFDLALSPRLDADLYHGHFITYFSGAAIRFAYKQREVIPSSNDINQLMTHVLSSTKPILHEVERNLEFLSLLGVKTADSDLEIWIENSDRAEAERMLSGFDIHNGDLIVAIAPGAGEPKKIWPIENFVALVAWLVSKYDLKVLVLGNQADHVLGERLVNVNSKPVYNVAGSAGLCTSAALLDKCTLLIGNDSGPIHLAAARSIPVIDISAHPMTGPENHPMSPMRFGPWRIPHKMVRPGSPTPPCAGRCRARYAHCICAISVNSVIQCVEDLLSQIGVDSSQSNRLRNVSI